MTSTRTSAAQHTPGPWGIIGVQDIESADGNSIAIVSSHGPTKEARRVTKANARLIAAAPEQHSTLEAIRNDCTAWLNGEMGLSADDLAAAIRTAAGAAIAKAEGRD